MDPVDNFVTKYVRLFDNIENDEMVENFARMEKWIGDGIDVAGETYCQFIEDIYQDNKLAENELYLGDEHIDLNNIDMPVLQIVGEYDHLIPPEASKPFNDVIASDDTSIIEFPTGHIGLSVSSSSHTKLWPEVSEWYAERSGNQADLEDIPGIGSAYAERLRDAGIDSPTTLANADVNRLAEETDISEATVRKWVDEAAQVEASK